VQCQLGCLLLSIVCLVRRSHPFLLAAMRRSLALLVLSVVSLSLLLPRVCGLYFHVVEGSRKCFIEEVPEDVLVMGKYTSPDHAKLNLNTATGQVDTDNFAAIRATVTDPRNEILLVHDTTAEGRFGFTSIVGGEHIICIATNTSSWYGQSRSFVSPAARDTSAHRFAASKTPFSCSLLSVVSPLFSAHCRR
jgi:hypothetical protein